MTLALLFAGCDGSKKASNHQTQADANMSPLEAERQRNMAIVNAMPNEKQFQQEVIAEKKKDNNSNDSGALHPGIKFTCIVDSTGFKNEKGETINAVKVTFAKPVNYSFDGIKLNAYYSDGNEVAHDGASFKNHGYENYNGQTIKTTNFVKEGEIKSLISFFLTQGGILTMFEKYSNNGFKTFMMVNSACKV
jgi:hypothetical protein